MIITREQIINEALEWKGTKWQHQAALKGVACDCAGLIRGVYRNITGIDVPINVDYPATWHLFKGVELCYQTTQKYLDEIPLSDIQAGDVVLFAYRNRFVAHHMGIVLPDGKFIHADMDAGVVHVSPFDDVWIKRLRYAFKFRGVV